MPAQPLTTLATLKDWLAIPETQTGTDDVLRRLILRASQKVYSFTGRSTFAPHLITETHDGYFRDSIMLREYPVLSIGSLMINGVPVPQSPTAQQSGFLTEIWNGYPPGHAQTVDLFGYSTGYGSQAVLVSYYAGYQITREAQTIPSGPGPFAISVDAPFGSWISDGGIVRADTGAALTRVTGAPSAGQYRLVDTALGDYAFSSSDAGTNILVTYGFVPGDVEQAVLEFVGDRDNYRRRIGIKERSVGGQGLTAYDDNAPSQTVLDLLQPYRRVMTG
jgi:hypothetical protein